MIGDEPLDALVISCLASQIRSCLRVPNKIPERSAIPWCPLPAGQPSDRARRQVIEQDLGDPVSQPNRDARCGLADIVQETGRHQIIARAIPGERFGDGKQVLLISGSEHLEAGFHSG